MLFSICRRVKSTRKKSNDRSSSRSKEGKRFVSANRLCSFLKKNSTSVLFLQPLIPVLDFYWRLPWVSKSGWIPGLHASSLVWNVFLRFTSSATPVDLLTASITLLPSLFGAPNLLNVVKTEIDILVSVHTPWIREIYFLFDLYRINWRKLKRNTRTRTKRSENYECRSSGYLSFIFAFMVGLHVPSTSPFLLAAPLIILTLCVSRIIGLHWTYFWTVQKIMKLAVNVNESLWE